MKEQIQMEIVQIAQKLLTNPIFLDNSTLLLKEIQSLYERALILHYLEKNAPEVLEKKTKESSPSDTPPPSPIPSTNANNGWEEIKAQVPEKEVLFEEKENTASLPKKEIPKTLNESIASKQLQIDLNDRIAFVTHLFNGNMDEFNRAITMLNNLHTPDECWDFVLHKVKPSYNNWQGKEEYEDRFFYIISKRFG